MTAVKVSCSHTVIMMKNGCSLKTNKICLNKIQINNKRKKCKITKTSDNDTKITYLS